MYDPMDFYHEPENKPSYARQITPILFGYPVFLPHYAIPGSTYDTRMETDKIKAWLTRLHGPHHNMYTESVEPGRVWIDAHSCEYQFMWPGDAKRFVDSLAVVREKAQYDSYSSGCDRAFGRDFNDPPETQVTVQQVREWVSEHCGISEEPGQRWTHAGYIFVFENPDHKFEFMLQFG